MEMRERVIRVLFDIFVLPIYFVGLGLIWLADKLVGHTEKLIEKVKK